MTDEGHSRESMWDEAVGAGMDMEMWRVEDVIDVVMKECNGETSYGRGQKYILRKLKERLRE